MTDLSKTTIWVSRATATRLRKLEAYTKQPYDEIIRNLLSYKELKEKGVDPVSLARSSKKG